MKSIQTKILTVVISGLLVITAVVSAIGVSMTHEIMHKDADRILNNVTEKEAAYLNDVLGDISKSAAIMQHYALAEIKSPKQLEDLNFRESYLEKTRTMFTEIARNTDGLDGFFLRINPKFTDGTTGYYNIIEGDTIKQMQVSDLNKYAQDDTKNVSWYYSAVRAGEPVWLEPYKFPGHDKQMISYTIPLYCETELLGVLGFDMDFSGLLERINQISVYENGYAILLAPDGETRYNNQHRQETDEPHTKAIAELRNGMYLKICADYKDIQRETRPILSRIVQAFLVVLLCAIVYTVFVTRKIVQPLKQLTATAKKIADGNALPAEGFDVKTNDEIGTLSRVLSNTYSKMQEYTAYINALAYKDSLTGVKNSTAYSETIGKLNQEINCGNPQFGVLVVDINNLKKTNDRYGHNIGDELIVHTAKILTECFKNSSVYRIGGDEFAVILTGKDYENYTKTLSQLDEASDKDYILVNSDVLPISLARGVSIFDPTIDAVYKDVFTKADQAMYMHKQESKAARV